MPLSKKGKKIMKSMKNQYGSKRGEQVFYASMNKGKIKGVEKKKNGGLGQKSGPPPKKGPASQGITVKKLSVGGGADMGGGGASGSSGSAGGTGGGGGRDAGMGMGGKSRSGGRDAGMGMGGKSRSGGRDSASGSSGSARERGGNARERGGNARDTQPSATVQPIKITPASVPIPLLKVKPKMFPFEYKKGGLVRGSGKVLKGRVKKAKIY